MPSPKKRHFAFGYSPEDVELASAVCEEYSAMMEARWGLGRARIVAHAEAVGQALRDYAMEMRGQGGHADE